MKPQRIHSWRCLNYGLCKKADESEKIDLPTESEFKCAECGSTEGLRLKPKRPPLALFALAGFGLVVVMIVVWLLGGGKGTEGPLPQPSPSASSSPAAKTAPVVGPNGLPMQVLAKPGAEMFYDRAGGKASCQPTNFERLFVFDQDPASEKIQVGRTNLQADGWIPKKDTMDWPHSIVVNFRDQQNRHPVLFFRDQDDLRKLVGSDKREDAAKQYYQEIDEHIRQGQVLPANFPVISIEPSHDGQQLIILPALAAEFIQINGVETRLLKVAAAGERRGGSDFRSDGYIKMLRELRQAAAARELSLKRIDMDIVFVVDTTGSMQPWVDGVFEAMRRIVQTAGTNGTELVRFGLWGYQDDDTMKGIQYRTRNFTPALATAKEFAGVISKVRVNKMTDDDYPEDVFAGVMDAIANTAWRSKNRVLVLIGDAPGHTTKREGGRKDIDTPAVRQIAIDAGVQIATLSIKDNSNPAYAQYHPMLEQQFKKLGENPGGRGPAYLSVNDKGVQIFQGMIEQLIGTLVDQPTALGKPLVEAPLDAGGIARGMLDSARARVVAQTLNASGESVMPNDITGWVFERDLIDPAIPALEAKLLVTRQELNHLVGLAEDLVEKLDNARILGTDFYSQMLEAVTGAATGGRSDTLKQDLPAFLKGLPYRSGIMDRSAEWFRALDAEGQKEFVSSIRSKLTYYREVNETPARWRSLSANASANLQVAEIPLNQLP